MLEYLKYFKYYAVGCLKLMQKKALREYNSRKTFYHSLFSLFFQATLSLCSEALSSIWTIIYFARERGIFVAPYIEFSLTMLL